MNAVSVARAIRQAPLLRRSERVWEWGRPAFEALLRLIYGRRGMLAAVGAGETMRVDPACRAFVWESDAGAEEQLWTALITAIRPGDRFADIGANIGVYSIAAARRGARVTSFEPNPTIAALLRRNAALNGVASRVDVREAAVAADAGELTLLPYGPNACAGRIDEAGHMRVRAVPLAEQYDLVKIDVEGYELEVLRGAGPLLSDPERRPRAIFLELHPRALGEGYLDAVSRLLRGYALSRLGTRALTEHWVALHQ